MPSAVPPPHQAAVLLRFDAQHEPTSAAAPYSSLRRDELDDRIDGPNRESAKLQSSGEPSQEWLVILDDQQRTVTTKAGANNVGPIHSYGRAVMTPAHHVVILDHHTPPGTMRFPPRRVVVAVYNEGTLSH
jgi:hypothetical protein